jgi:hypothetical protein
MENVIEEMRGVREEVPNTYYLDTSPESNSPQELSTSTSSGTSFHYEDTYYCVDRVFNILTAYCNLS